MSRTRMTALASIFLVGTLALSGCSLLGGGTDDGTQQTDGTNSSSQADGSQGQASGEPGVVAYDESKVVATQEVTMPNGLGTATVEIYPLRVEGKTQIMTAFITPHLANADPSSPTYTDFRLYDFNGERRWEPVLIDQGNLKQYSPLESTGQDFWTTDYVTAIGTDGVPMPVWAVFAAPQDGTTSFDVVIGESYPRFENIPVE
ncbi:hypothetical protein [Pseudoclavibacter sp. JSM 162008]|uniref:hypothetical protein n=1 Tax=Pseudoclavibacter sp. JSM 162008 TaxID=3229855 RepID=UPI003525F3DE